MPKIAEGVDEKILDVLKALDYEGTKTPERWQIRQKLAGMAESTFQRHLKALIGSEILHEGNLYSLLKNRDELRSRARRSAAGRPTDGSEEISRSESPFLLDSLLRLVKGPTFRNENADGYEDSLRYMPDLITHILTGYPEERNLVREYVSLREREGKLRRRIEMNIRGSGKNKGSALEALGDKSVIHGKEMPGLDMHYNLWQLILEEMESRAANRDSRVSKDELWEERGEGGVWFAGKPVADHLYTSKEAKDFVLVQAAKNMAHYRAYVGKSAKATEKWGKLVVLLEPMRKNLENGRPLKGVCSNCRYLGEERAKKLGTEVSQALRYLLPVFPHFF